MDDEPWARKRIASLLSSESDFSVAGECSSGEQAVVAIHERAPEVVFLDVQMRGLDGFCVVDSIGVQAMPLVVFATAFQEYAVRAFDAGAVDYLLKPFDEERFRRALARVRRDRGTPGHFIEGLDRVMTHLRQEGRFCERIAAYAGTRLILVQSQEVDWFEATGNYVTLHVGREQLLLRSTLAALETKLNPVRFVRLHRSAIVNVERIRELLPWSRGEQVILLRDGTRLTIGRAFRDRVAALI